MTEKHSRKAGPKHETWEDCLRNGLLDNLPSVRLLFGGEQIEERVPEICRRVVSEHIGSCAPERREVVLVPIMEGAVMVASGVKAELTAACPTLAVAEHPILIRRTAGEELIPPTLDAFGHDASAFRGRTVIIIDDLTDKGETLRLAQRIIRRCHHEKLITLALVQKRDSPSTVFIADYTCFHLDYDAGQAERKWLFGYGMDVRGELRNCNFIAELIQKKR